VLQESALIVIMAIIAAEALSARIQQSLVRPRTITMVVCAQLRVTVAKVSAQPDHVTLVHGNLLLVNGPVIRVQSAICAQVVEICSPVQPSMFAQDQQLSSLDNFVLTGFMAMQP
jgi:hypothetical protein